MSEVERFETSPNDILVRYTEILDRGEEFPRVPRPPFFYAFFRYSAEVLGVNDFSTYMSTVITSGGAALPDKEGQMLSFGEAIRRNSVYAMELASAVIADNPDLLSDKTTVNPVALGKVPIYHYEQRGSKKIVDGAWGQDDFLRLWFAVILGLRGPTNPDSHGWYDTELYIEELFAVHADANHETVAIMNDKTAETAARRAAYMQFTTSFLRCVQLMQEESQLEVHPMERIIRLIDPERSLGGQAEVQLAKSQAIPLFDVALTGDEWQKKGHAALAEDLSERQAAFAVSPGKLVLALTTVPSELPSDGGSLQSYRERLRYPIQQCIWRFMASADFQDEDERVSIAVRGAYTLSEFQIRRPDAYQPEVVYRLMGGK